MVCKESEETQVGEKATAAGPREGVQKPPARPWCGPRCRCWLVEEFQSLTSLFPLIHPASFGGAEGASHIQGTTPHFTFC